MTTSTDLKIDLATEDFANSVANLAGAFRAAGIAVPTVSESIDEFLETFPDYTLEQRDLRFLVKYAGGDVHDVVAGIPAEKVPAEISGAWYEIRSTLPLLQQIHEYLTDPDDQPEPEPDPLDELRAQLQAAFNAR